VEADPFSSVRIPIRIGIGPKHFEEMDKLKRKGAAIPEVRMHILNLQTQELKETKARFIYPGTSVFQKQAGDS
jgi:hypothetical protein